MIPTAVRALSLAAAVAMTSGATAALNTYGVWSLPEIGCRLGPPPPLIHANIEPGLTPPPPLPTFIHPRVVRVRVPQIVCEVPGDPMAVTDCGTGRAPLP